MLWAAVTAIPLATLAGLSEAALWPAVGVLAALAGVAAGDALMSLRYLASVELSCSKLARLTAGAGGEIEIEAESADPRALRLALALPRALTTESPRLSIELPGGRRRVHFGWPLEALERGRHAVESCLIGCPSWLGLWEMRRVAPLAGEVRVYPSLREERRSLAARFLLRGGIGAHAQRRIGKGREFEKLREYLPGDSLDDVHWKASAKRGQPVTKEYQIERTQEVYAVIDVSRLSLRPNGGQPTIERVLRASLALALATRQYGDLFGLIVFSDQVRTFLRARSGKIQYDACREAIYNLSPNPVSPDFAEVASFIRMRLRRRALLVFLTDLDDPAHAEDFVRASGLIARHHVVVAAMIRPEEASPLFTHSAGDRDDIVRHLAGHLRWHRLRELARVLQVQGVHLTLLDHACLASEVVSHYVSVKQRQLL
jgi:uncharacterized protein (DUF58 family)